MFPIGAPSAYYHTAEMHSVAQVISDAYTNASGIYQNFFPQSCDSTAINQWEIKVFGQLGDSSLTLAQRQALVIQKLQAPRGISLAIMYQVVNFTLPGLSFEIVPYSSGQGNGGWELGVSQLGFDTYLNYNTQYYLAYGPQLCSDTPATWGLSAQDWANLQAMAYGYEVRIYGTTLTALQRAKLDAALTKAEPARSYHVILDGLDPSQMINSTTVPST